MTSKANGLSITSVKRKRTNKESITGLNKGNPEVKEYYKEFTKYISSYFSSRLIDEIEPIEGVRGEEEEGKDNGDKFVVENRSDMLFAIHDALNKSANATSTLWLAKVDEEDTCFTEKNLHGGETRFREEIKSLYKHSKNYVNLNFMPNATHLLALLTEVTVSKPVTRSDKKADYIVTMKKSENTYSTNDQSDFVGLLLALEFNTLIDNQKLLNLILSSAGGVEDDTFVDVFGRDLFFILYRFMTGNIMGIGTTHFSVISDATHPFMWRMLLNLRPSETFIDIKGLGGLLRRSFVTNPE